MLVICLLPVVLGLTRETLRMFERFILPRTMTCAWLARLCRGPASKDLTQ